MGNRFSGLGGALWNSKRKQFLGRDGAGWAKLGTFYFFFYIGLAGFFCAMLAVFMALSPRDRPRYILEASRMRTRSNPLAPGLGFRPQPDVDKNLIYVDKDDKSSERNPYATNLEKYLQVYYWKQDQAPVSAQKNAEENESAEQDSGEEMASAKKFSIANPGDCTPENEFGYAKGKPCVLVKMNKLVEFVPKPGAQAVDKAAYQAACQPKQNFVAIHCTGENFADADNIGNITYYSENGKSNTCGALELENFPYLGKSNRKDVYQAPYVWVQFQNPTPDVLINVLCRVYAQNIELDKKTGRGITRFQIYVKGSGKRRARVNKVKEI